MLLQSLSCYLIVSVRITLRSADRLRQCQEIHLHSQGTLRAIYHMFPHVVNYLNFLVIYSTLSYLSGPY